MRYISELIDKKRDTVVTDSGVVLCLPDIRKTKSKVHVVALGDVGGTLLIGLRLLGGDVISSIGIYDLQDEVLSRYEMEINQIRYPGDEYVPPVKILTQEELFDCDVFVFCATSNVPPMGFAGDIRMAQLEANKVLVSGYASGAVKAGYKGIFAVVSDPVDPLCKMAMLCGLEKEQVQGYGLGVMNGRASYFAEKDERFSQYLSEGRVFGPHGFGLVVADSIENYNDEISQELTELTTNANMRLRDIGFKPYMAPSLSSGAISIIETLRGNWNYSSVYFGAENSGAFLGCRNRRTGDGIEIENLALPDKLFTRIESAYENLKSIL